MTQLIGEAPLLAYILLFHELYLTTLLTSPIEFSLYFQNYVRHLNQNFREMRKIYEMGLRSKIMRVNLFYKVP